jgi:hypothetical protein
VAGRAARGLAGATRVDVHPEDNPSGVIAAGSGEVIRGPAAAAITASRTR